MKYRASRKVSRRNDTEDGSGKTASVPDGNKEQTDDREARGRHSDRGQQSQAASGEVQRFRGPSTGASEASNSESGYVEYNPGPDPGALSDQYGVEVGRSEARKLQRLQEEFGSERVQRWADEGMPVEAMGKPRDMKAFREREEEQSDGGAGDGNRGPDKGSGSAPEAVERVVSSSGQSLEQPVQREMEAKMGGDFSDVAVHTGSKAADAAESINARAFTVGTDVAFNEGEYRPGSESGKKVLAHELTHVRQQTDGRVSTLAKAGAEPSGPDGRAGASLQVQPKLEVSSPDDPAEKEAEQVAERVVEMDAPAQKARSRPRQVSGKSVQRGLFSDAASSVADAAESAVEGVADAAESAIDSATGAVEAISEGVSDLGEQAWSMLESGGEKVWNALGSNQEAFVNMLGKGQRAWNVLKEGGEKLSEVLVNSGKRVWSALENTGGRLWDLLQEKTEVAVDIIRRGGQEAWNVLKRGGRKLWPILQETGGQVWDVLANTGRRLWELAESDDQFLKNMLKNGGSRVWAILADGGREVWEVLKDKGPGIWNVLSNTGRRLWDVLSRNGELLANVLQSGKREAWQVLKKGGARVWTILQNSKQQIWDVLANTGRRLYGLLSSNTKLLLEMLSSGLQRVPELLRSARDRLWELLQTAGGKVWDHIQDSVFWELLRTAKGFFEKLLRYGKEKPLELLKEGGRRLVALVEDTGRWILDVMTEMGRRLWTLLEENAPLLAKLLREGSQKFWAFVEKHARKFWNVLSNTTQEVIMALLSAGRQFGRFLSRGLDRLGSLFETIGEYALLVIETFFQQLGYFFSEFPRRILRIWTEFGEGDPLRFFQWLWEGLQQLMSDPSGMEAWLASGAEGEGRPARMLTSIVDILPLAEAWALISTLFRGGRQPDEVAELKTVIGDAVTYDSVRIVEDSSLSGDAFVTGHVINLPPDDSDPSPGNSDFKTLVHEFVHVGQYEAVGTRYIPEAIHAQNSDMGYDYRLEDLENESFDFFNREQQASILGDLYGHVDNDVSDDPNLQIDGTVTRAGTDISSVDQYFEEYGNLYPDAEKPYERLRDEFQAGRV